MLTSRIGVRFLAPLLLAACSTSAVDAGTSSEGTLRHPVDSFIVRSTAPHRTVSLSAADTPVDGNVRLTMRYTYGAERGGLKETFGSIDRAIVSIDDHLVTLDRRRSQVRVFTPMGVPIGDLGDAADGRLILATPAVLAEGTERQIYVGGLDRMVTILGVTETGLRELRRIRLDRAPRSLCVMGDSLYAASWAYDDAQVVRVYDRDGAPLGAFAEVYESPNAFVNYHIRRGHIACDTPSRTVLWAPDAYLAELRAYHANGVLRWSLALETDQLGAYVETATGMYADRLQAGEYRFGRLHVVAPDTALYQLRFVAPSGETSHVLSLFVAVGSGDIVRVARDLPLFVAARSGLAASVAGAPFPQLTAWDLEYR